MYTKALALLIRNIGDSIFGLLAVALLVVLSAKQQTQVVATNPPRAYGSRT